MQDIMLDIETLGTNSNAAIIQIAICEFDRKTGEVTHGKIPPYSVVVPGSLPDKNNPAAPSLYCAVIIKQVDEKTRSKTSVNDLLRD